MSCIESIKKLPGMEFLQPATEKQIKSAEEKLGLRFAEEYREYLSYFGMVWSDIIAISGICDDEDYEVVALTDKLKKVYLGIPSDFYVIEDVGVDGLVIWQSGTGEIYQSIPNTNPVKIFDSLSDFLIYQMED